MKLYVPSQAESIDAFIKEFREKLDPGDTEIDAFTKKFIDAYGYHLEFFGSILVKIEHVGRNYHLSFKLQDGAYFLPSLKVWIKLFNMVVTHYPDTVFEC